MSDFRIAPQKGKARPIEEIPQFWNPNRGSIRMAPSWFMQRVNEVDGHRGDIAVTWNSYTERWQVFYRSPRVQHPICSGWTLLFIQQGPSGEYWPLDERLLARLESCSAKANGSGLKYFDRIVAEMKRDEEKFDKQWRTDTIDAAMPSYDHAQIQVAMRGKSNGSKFSTYHA